MEALLTITQINDFIFCPYSLYCSGIFRNTADVALYHGLPQKNGLNAHNAIDIGSYSTRRDVLMGTMVYSEKYGLIGKIDIFDIKTGILTERKYSVTAVYPGFRFQLYAQYFALGEMGYDVKALRLYSSKDNKVYEVGLPGEGECREFEVELKKIREWKPDAGTVSVNQNKCAKCIYSTVCAYFLQE